MPKSFDGEGSEREIAGEGYYVSSGFSLCIIIIFRME